MLDSYHSQMQNVYSVITDLLSLAICLTVFNILELGACHKIPPPSEHNPPNQVNIEVYGMLAI